MYRSVGNFRKISFLISAIIELSNLDSKLHKLARQPRTDFKGIP